MLSEVRTGLVKAAAGGALAIGLAAAGGGARAEVPPAAPVQVTVLEKVQLPWQQPEVIVRALTPAQGVDVEAACEGANPARATFARLAAGSSRSLLWNIEAGRRRCRLSVSGTADGKTFRVEQNVHVDVLPELHIALRPADVDLEARTAKVRLDRPGAFVELSLYDLDGRMLHQATHDLESAKNATELTLSWPAVERDIARIDVRAFGRDDSWAELTWEPIQIELMPEPVYFDAGDAWALAGAQQQKLDDAVSTAKKTAAEHRGAKGLGLYVLAVFDGDADAAISQKRADSVARYFRKKGLKLPTFAGTTREAGRRPGEVVPILTQAPPEGEFRRIQ